MVAIIDFIILVFKNIVNVLNIRPFSDINISYLEILLSSVVITYLLRLVFGGIKEIDHNTDNLLFSLKRSKSSKKMSDKERKEQVNNYIPKHAKKEYIPKHSKD